MKKIKVGLYIVFALIMIATHIAHAQAEGVYRDAPRLSGRGSVMAKSLERSTVDLASEFVNMITNQRGFQANAKTITTSDELLNEVIQLKR